MGTGRAWLFGTGFVGLVLASGCGLAPLPRGVEVSLGRASRGVLIAGAPLPERGPGYVRALPGEPTRYATAALVQGLERAARAVAERYPGSGDARVGDLSLRGGGKHPRHGSHRTGRDADVLYYLLDEDGHSARGRGWLAFGPAGFAVESSDPAAPGNGGGFFFDTARNWHWVRTLLGDPDLAVEWIFCGADVKARLLRWGALHETDPDILVRAASVLHQPSYGNPHVDHFHVRLACTAAQRDLGCHDVGPSWPWLRLAHEKPTFHAQRLGDAELVRELLEPLPNPSDAVANR